MYFIEARHLTLDTNGVNIMNNIDMIKEKAATAEDMARKVWLAGLG
ncbi:MAG: hypothetical protein ACJASL_001266, partial [Paraglaciecola sp.]